MKLHYALAALAVAAVSFVTSAAVGDDLFGGQAVPKGCQQTPYQQGWRSSSYTESDFVTNGGAGKLGYRNADLGPNGFENGATVFNIIELNKKLAFPVAPTAMKVYELQGHLWRRNGGDSNITYNFYFAGDIDANNLVSKASFNFNNDNKAINLNDYKLHLYTTEQIDNLYFIWEATNTTNWQEGGLAHDVKLVEVGDLAIVKYVTIDNNEVVLGYFIDGEEYVINSIPGVTPTPGYYFEGWCTDEACTQMVQFPLTVTTNTTLYPKMTKKPVNENFMNMWDGHGKGNADLASDFGWAATPEVSWHVAFEGVGYYNGYRDDSTSDQVRAVISSDTGSVFSYPVVGLTKGYYRFTAKVSHINRLGAVHTFSISENMDGTGKVYGASDNIVIPNWPNTGVPVSFEFELNNDVDVAYMCWTMGNAGDRALSWDYSLTKVEYSEVYAQKKAEAIALLANEDYANVSGVEKSDLEALANTTVEPTDYSQAIKALNDAMNTFKAAAPAYNAWVAIKAKAEAEDVKSLYDGADAQYMTPLNAALETDCESAEAAKNAADVLNTLVADAIMGKVLGAGVDMTSEIKGALMPEDGDFSECWTTDYAGGSEANGMHRNVGEEPTVWNLFNGYYDTNCYEYDNWHWTLSQNLNLPAGNYTIAVMCRAAAAEHEYTMTIGEESIALFSQGNAGQELGNGWARVFKAFKVTASEQGAQNMPGLAADEIKTYPVTLKLHIGVGAVKNNWFSFNNFKLVQNKAEDNPTGIEVVEVERNVPVVYYNLNGVRVDGSNLTPGVYVVRQGAKAEKIMVK